MHNLYPKLTFFLILLFTFSVNADDVKWKLSSFAIDNRFVGKVINQNMEDACERLSNDTKLTICNYIFRSERLKSKYDQPIFLNKNACKNLHLFCKENTLSFEHVEDYNKLKIKRMMFTCYGRHNPIRTGWYFDDALNYFHVATGTTFSEFYIFRYDKYFTEEGDRYVLVASVKNLNVGKLIVPVLYDAELETKSLQKVSRNSAVEEIEINYIREENTKKDSICNLSIKRKIMICQLIVSQPHTLLRHTVIDTSAFNLSSSECITKTLNFRFASENNEADRRLTADMFPCFGTNESISGRQWYLADGKRDLSVSVFIDYGNYYEVQFYEFYENVHISEYYFPNKYTSEEASSSTASNIESNVGSSSSRSLSRYSKKKSKRSTGCLNFACFRGSDTDSD